jgi:hypothetical protein
MPPQHVSMISVLQAEHDHFVTKTLKTESEQQKVLQKTEKMQQSASSRRAVAEKIADLMSRILQVQVFDLISKCCPSCFHTLGLIEVKSMQTQDNVVQDTIAAAGARVPQPRD